MNGITEIKASLEKLEKRLLYLEDRAKIMDCIKGKQSASFEGNIGYRDPEKTLSYCTDDVEWIWGDDHWKGRKEMMDYWHLYDGLEPRNIVDKHMVLSIDGDTATARHQWVWFPHGKMEMPNWGFQTYVLKKQRNGEWKIAQSEDTNLPPLWPTQEKHWRIMKKFGEAAKPKKTVQK